MKKYTLKSIKETVCYKANIEDIKAIYPDHWHLFANELMMAANRDASDWEDSETITETFTWWSSPQGSHPWNYLNFVLVRYRNGSWKL